MHRKKKEVKNANFLRSYLKNTNVYRFGHILYIIDKENPFIYLFIFSILVRRKKHECFVEKENTKYRVVTEELHKNKAADWSFPEIQQNSSRKTNKRLTLSQIH